MNFSSVAPTTNTSSRSYQHCIAQSRLVGKIAAVTASTDGIGLAIARRLAQEGAKVIISSRKQEKVDEAVAKLKGEGFDVTGLVCHVANAKDRKKLFDKVEELGGLDILVSNAAVNPVQGTVFAYDKESWGKLFDVNVTSSFLLAKEAYPFLKKRGGGCIIFMSSVAGYGVMQSEIGAYCVSKTALFGLTKLLSLELGADNIRVNCVSPGAINTNFGKFILKNTYFKTAVLNRTPISRIGIPEDVSGIVAFLASDDSLYISGENIVAAGGIHARI